MTNPGDWRVARDPAEGAAETREPEEAARVRAADDAATRERQDAAESTLRRADDALESNRARLSETGEQLREREDELARTDELTRDLARAAAELRATTDDVAETVRRVPPRDR
jgi:ABC-type transporter Mla subunit MlaD